MSRSDANIDFRRDARGTRKTFTYFCLLFAGLFWVYRPVFRHPPRSDYWSAFFVFQQLDTSPPPPGWLGVMTFDLWEHGTYRPLSHLVPYLQHRLFSPAFFWNQFTNFAGYFLSLILLFRLAVKLSIDRTLAAIAVTVFAFLFSHFDILAWSFQLFAILGFCAFLFGFILHIDYLRSGRGFLLLPTGALFLAGMLASEVYAFWPPAVLILPYLLPDRPRFRWRDAAPLLVYPFYLAGWLIHRGATGGLPAPSSGDIGLGFLLVFFNLAYTGIAVNLLPSLALPVFYDDNMNLGGRLLDLGGRLEAVTAWTGAAVLLIVLLGAFRLIRGKRFHLLALLGFFGYLYLTNFFTVAVARLTTNRALYPLSQFRYQYVPNALLALALAAAADRLFRPRPRGKAIIALILTPVLVFNIALSRRQIADLGERLRPLGTMLVNIRRGLEEGKITEEDRLSIAPEVPEKVPPPGWNRGMSDFMEGSFHWFFPAEDMDKFSLRPEDAAWVVTGESFPEIAGNPGRIPEDE